MLFSAYYWMNILHFLFSVRRQELLHLGYYYLTFFRTIIVGMIRHSALIELLNASFIVDFELFVLYTISGTRFDSFMESQTEKCAKIEISAWGVSIVGSNVVVLECIYFRICGGAMWPKCFATTVIVLWNFANWADGVVLRRVLLVVLTADVIDYGHSYWEFQNSVFSNKGQSPSSWPTISCTHAHSALRLMSLIRSCQVCVNAVAV